MRYLDPKNDLIFKRVFGQHPHILISFLNALLPLQADEYVVSLEYLPAELVPDLPLMKHSIVDVRCMDNRGRQFIVEMQMLWTDSFKSRVLFNASKAYVRQLEKSREYIGLHPVYALSIINEKFEPDTDEYYHHYRLVHSMYPEKLLKGLELIFIELPKFKVDGFAQRRLHILWLRFLSEIENKTEMIPEEFMEVPELKEAVELTKESSYTKAELEAYDVYWDSIRSEKSLIADAEAKGEQIGMQKGEQIGMQKGEVKGERNKAIQSARKLKEMGILNSEQIAEVTGLSLDEINNL